MVTGIAPLPPAPGALRHRQRLLDASTGLLAVGVLIVIGFIWGPPEWRPGLLVVLALAAVVACLHTAARPALFRWANAAQAIELPEQTRELLSGTGITQVAVTMGTISDGDSNADNFSDNVRMRCGSSVLITSSLAVVDPRRLAALLMGARPVGRGTVAPAVLSASFAGLAAWEGWWGAVAVATVVAVAWAGLGLRHDRQHRRNWMPDDYDERVGVDAYIFAFLVTGWTDASRTARNDPLRGGQWWADWVENTRTRAVQDTPGLTVEIVDAEIARLQSLGR